RKKANKWSLKIFKRRIYQDYLFMVM
ncbi:hypothetical protein A5819_003552, partial [Enterococcus sp. 7E2_DIV0204]